MATPLKVGLVGTGGISRAHMTAYLEHPDRVQLTAVCDIVEPAAQEYAKKTGVEAVYTDFDQMLREADIDAVDNCTGHAQHAPLSIAAAEAGKHVIVEKAMALTVQECRDMVAAADKAGVILMVAQHLRHSPDAAAVKRFIDEGKLGDIVAVRTHLIGRGPRGGWMSDGNQGGGILQVEQIHHIDLLRYYVGNVKRLTGIWKSLQERMLNGADDLVVANFEFENGVLGDLYGSWNTNLAPVGREYRIFGTKGIIHSTPAGMPREDSPTRHFGTVMVGLKGEEELDPRNPRDLQRSAHPPFEPIDTSGTEPPTLNYFVNEILHFEECARTGREPISSGRDNIETIKIVHGIFESSRTGKPVDLDDL